MNSKHVPLSCPAVVPPTIVLRPPVDNTVNQGESIQITCVAYGSPIPSIYWSKPGCLRMGNNTNNIYVFSDMITVSNVTMHRSMLQICNADTDDNTQYSCWADNGVTGMGLGDSSADFNVQVFVRKFMEHTVVLKKRQISLFIP